MLRKYYGCTTMVIQLMYGSIFRVRWNKVHRYVSTMFVLRWFFDRRRVGLRLRADVKVLA